MNVRFALTAFVVAGLATLVIGCAGPVGAPSSSTGATSTPASPIETSPSPSVDGPPLPPQAFLVIGSDRYPGSLGGYDWQGFSDSAPWLPADALPPVHAGEAARLEVVLADAVDIDSWLARAATAADRRGDALFGLGEGPPPIGFARPAAGSWVVSVTLQFASGQGDAAWYWRVEVP